MGQPIQVTSRPGSRPEIMIFSVNRSLTGMKIEVYRDPAEAIGDRWCDELARRLAGLGATKVTVYASSIVVESPDWSGGQREQAEETIGKLYVYYTDGRMPPTDEEVMAAAEG